VVIHANFLIDAESNLKSALDGFVNSGETHSDGAKPDEAPLSGGH